MKVISKLILLIGITATAFCTKDAAVIPFDGTWTITNIDSKIVSNTSGTNDIDIINYFNQNDSNLYIKQYKWDINKNILMVKNNNIVVGSFIITHKSVDSISLEYLENRIFRYPPSFQYKQINNSLILNVNLYYDANVCGVNVAKSIERHLTLTLTK
jgi:hypothetical protein